MDLARTTPRSVQTAPLVRQSGGLADVRLVSIEQAFEPDFANAWASLARRASTPNPFFEPWFVRASVENAQRSQCVLLAHFSGAELTGILPLSRSWDYYGYRLPHWTGWFHANAFCGAPLVAAGFESLFWQDTLGALDRNAGTAMFLHLPQMPQSSPVNRALDAVATKTGRHVATVNRGERAMLSSPLGPQEYYGASVSAKKRKELRRQRRRLEELGDLRVERFEGGEAVDRWTDEFLALEAAGWKGKAGSALGSRTQTRAFFAQTLSHAASEGKLSRLALRLDDKAIAMLVSFKCPPGVFSFKTAFDESYAPYSPGLLLQIENLDLLDDESIEWADSCAIEGHSMIERLWREKRAIVSRNVTLGGPLRRMIGRQLAAYETRGNKQL